MKVNWNDNWEFTKETGDEARWEQVTLPHTWNGTDGQDGGNDYYRGVCRYRKILRRADIDGEIKKSLPEAEKGLTGAEKNLPENLWNDQEIYLEMEGANSSAELYVDGQKVMRHDGGYSTWRARITPFLKKEETEILLAVDNSPNGHVYPQKADFTFYGGLYRNVNLLCVGKAHFDLDYYGSRGVKVTPEVEGKNARVTAEAFLSGTTGNETLEFQILDQGKAIAEKIVSSADRVVELEIPDVHLWNGRKDPYLYTLRVRLLDKGAQMDVRELRFGCRTFAIDPEKGFLLNGESYPLRGVARHQDRPGIGNALLPQHHREDMDLICEMGANTIRLAHYQHDQYFYDLCDERGIVVWAEIPYISAHLPGGMENTLSQMRELIVQNYHHPSIVVWGLSNEITIGGTSDPDLLENHHALNDLAHHLDPTRLTTLAVVTVCDMDEEYVHITDVVSYNHYFGWYGGDISMNGEFMDRFHQKYPDTPIGMSEYGCEALNWHSSDPVQGDYTEEYQAYYHEELIKQLYTRPYIWATHAWNMFDFAADARSEGGEDGMNHKGLVTFDRKYKKDAFYAYKAWLSDEPFVHICGKRYVDRVEDTTKVTVYSNLPEVELFANGVSLGKQKSEEHFFYFQVPNAGETTLVAKAGACTDESFLRKTEVFNEAYRLKEAGDVINWFEITAPEGYFSINDKFGDIMKNKKGAQCVKRVMLRIMLRYRWRSRKNKQPTSQKLDMNNPGIRGMLGGMSVKRMASMASTVLGFEVPKEMLLNLNRKLNKIHK